MQGVDCVETALELGVEGDLLDYCGVKESTETENASDILGFESPPVDLEKVDELTSPMY